MPGLLDYTKKNYEDGDTVNPMSSGLVANWLSRALLDRGELIPNYGEFNRLLMNEPEPGDRLTPEEGILKELLGSALEPEEDKPISSPFKGYQDGGGVDFDPYEYTNQQDTLDKLGISITNPNAKSLLPTYDRTSEDMAREGYNLRSDPTTRGARGSLFDLTTETNIKKGGTGFSGSGMYDSTYSNVREDIVSGFGQAADEQYLDFQRDILGIRKDYEGNLLSAVGDLDPDDYQLGNPGALARNTEQRQIREALNRGETLSRGEGQQWQPPTGMGYEGEQRYGNDGIVYTWSSSTNSWVPRLSESGAGLEARGAYGV